MKAYFPLAVLFTVPAFALAPETLAGKVYRESTAFLGIRQSWEKTVVFGADGHFAYLKYGSGYALQLSAPYKIFLGAPKSDGTYVYHRSSDNAATVALSGDDGTSEVLTLNFTADRGGGGGDSSFTVTDVANTTAPIVNQSLRGHVSANHPVIAGLVIPGTIDHSALNLFAPSPNTPIQEVLIRAVGPGLARFGVTDTWADPDFQIFSGNKPATVNEIHYADWTVPPFGTGVSSPTTEAAFRKIFTAVGAFPLDSGSKDAAAVVRLNPGAYTIVCTAGADDPGGEVLIEVYLLP